VNLIKHLQKNQGLSKHHVLDVWVIKMTLSLHTSERPIVDEEACEKCSESIDKQSGIMK
jgi:hypothetical protein